MNTLLDICKRSIYMNLFIVVIPLIAYMIHNGSSATVALVWYLLLSLCIPWTYVSYRSSTFGRDGYHINRWIFIVSWIFTQVLTYKVIFLGINLSFIWELPNFARDIVFLIGMYGQVTLSLLLAFGGTRLLGGACE